MFRPAGEAVLVDFGLSRHDQLPDLMEEEFRLPFGTAPYMAPEQVLGVRNDPRSDLFALGVLAVLLLHRRAAVRRKRRRLRGMRRRLWRDPVPPRRLRPDYPPWLQEIMLRCLEIEPAWRYPTAAHLAFDLEPPEQVKLTARSERLKRDPWSIVMKRRFNPETAPAMRKESIVNQLDSAPIIAVAVDLSQSNEPLHDSLRVTVKRILDTVPGARVACLNVLKESRG